MRKEERVKFIAIVKDLRWADTRTRKAGLRLIEDGVEHGGFFGTRDNKDGTIAVRQDGEAESKRQQSTPKGMRYALARSVTHVIVILFFGPRGASSRNATHASFSSSSSCPGNRLAVSPSVPIPSNMRSNVG